LSGTNSLFIDITSGSSKILPLFKEFPAGGYLEIGSSHFNLNSAVFLPNDSERQTPDESEDIFSSGIVMIERTIHFLELTSKKLLIAGHTDTVGDPQANITLSKYRAEGVYSILTGDRDLFKTVSNAPHIPDKGTKFNTLLNDKIQIAEWAAKEFNWTCSLKENHNDIFLATKAFQQCYNRDIDKINPGGELLSVDGDWGPKTWGAVFDSYQAKLAQRLTIPSKKLNEYRSKLNLSSKFVFPSKHFIACGENHPIDRPGADETLSAKNRRVEMIFFDDGPAPEISCISGECDGTDCGLFGPLQEIRGKVITAAWQHPLVLASHAEKRNMIVHHAGADPGSTVTFTVYQVCDGEIKTVPEPVTTIVTAGFAIAEFNELSDKVHSLLSPKEGQIFYSYFFIAKSDKWMTVSARLHSEFDGALHE